ncbi:cyclin-domain-containing protein, partial [Zopfia rhizophila CBS 207.26]
PPSAPNPSADQGVIPSIAAPNMSTPSPPTNEDWDVNTMAPETAMKLLARAVTQLAAAAGDVPPTPPVSRPATPKGKENAPPGHRRTSSRPATPIPSDDVKAPNFQGVNIEAPEACNSEPIMAGDIGEGAQPDAVQEAHMARKFFSKTPPKISIEEYLMRLQHFCPMSTAVYLAAATYIYRMGIEDRTVPITARTVHRLVLGSLRTSMKALEDLKYSCERFSLVGGVDGTALHRLERSVCFLVDFDLQVTAGKLKVKVTKLQNAAQAATLATKLPNSFELKL